MPSRDPLVQIRMAVAYKALQTLARFIPPLATLVDYDFALSSGNQLDSGEIRCPGVSRMKDGSVYIYLPSEAVITRVVAHIMEPPRQDMHAVPSFEEVQARQRVSSLEAGASQGTSIMESCS